MTTQDRSTSPGRGQESEIMDTPLEVLVVPVSDVDRAKDFYTMLGWRLDADRTIDEFRLVQATPPGSGCSVQFGAGLTTAEPGSAQGQMMTVADVQAARDALAARGAQISEVFHCAAGTACRFKDGDGAFERASGSAPGHLSYSSFATLSDPDGNGWILQEVTARLPGRVGSGRTSFGSAADLAEAMTRASMAHGEHEKRIGHTDAGWPDWYARYMVAEQTGTELPQ
jgi:catechol 2,3-dioxygenase-like lactoylglutathione lyase family enzyme